MADVCKLFVSGNLLVHLGVLLIQFLTAITTIITQALLDDGVEKLVLGSYCFLLSASLLGVLSIFVERRNNINLTLDVIPWVLFFGVLLCAIQLLGLVGISYTSASFVSALHPTTSVFTAIFAVIAGVETLKLLRYDGQIKIAGILVCMSGAILMSLYTGPCVVCSTEQQAPSQQVIHAENPESQNFGLGALCIIFASVITAALGVFAAKFISRPVATISSLTLTFAVGGLISGTAAWFTLDKAAWVLPIKLVPLVLFISFCSLSLIPMLALWGLRRLGPTTVSCYQPVATVITAILSVFFLGSSIFLGSIIGASLIVIGLVLVSWAQEECFHLSNKETSEADLEASLLPSDEPKM